MNPSIQLTKRFVFAMALFPLVLPAQTLTLTNGIHTFSALTNTTVTMTGHCELRVTGTDDPIAGSIINLNSTDAWFLLSNLRPSAVSASHLSRVRINGSVAVAGINCRLDQYAMGTVIVPHAPGFTPLQIFSGPNFIGASAQLGLYTYYTNTALGTFNRNIGSFKLKRGYSATFAQNADGTGASKVFVAQDGDIEVGVLAANLNRPVSFVRVFPWRWTGKKGWSGGVQMLVNPLWNYDWNNEAASTLDAEYVPMRWGLYWNSYANINGKQKSTHVLGYNEPDKTDQANMSVETAIAAWPALMQSGLRVGAPAVSDSATTGMGLQWLYSFMSQADALGYRVDYVPIHFYKCDWSATQFSNYLAGVYLQTGRPVWVTEFNNGANWCSSDPTPAQNATVISSFINMLESAPFVERYAIYNWVGTNRAMVADDGTLTPAGIVYRDKQSAIGYTQALPTGGGRSIAQFLFEADTLDSSGYGNNGCAVGIPDYAAGRNGQALALDGTNSFVQLPPNVANSADFSFAAWVYWNGGLSWQRVFDFGNDTSHYLFLTPSSGSGTLRFAIRNGGSEQIVETAALTGGQWQHVAVTLSGNSARIYTNGVLASSGPVTIVPSHFNPNRNYLGKSQFANDPLFQGNLDEVQIADYALTDAQIAALQTNLPPQFTTNFLDRGTAAPFEAFSGTIAGTATDPDAGDTLTYSKAGGLAWLTVNADGTLAGMPGSTDGGTNYFTVRVTDSAGASALAVMIIHVPITYASGIWTADASGNWSETNKWNGGIVANGAGYTADFSALNITADRTVTLDESRSIGTLKFGDTSGGQNWTLASGGDVLTLDTGSSAAPSVVVNQNAVTIAAPLAGVYGFGKSGSGTLILSGANSLSGTVNIDTSSTSTGEGAVRVANPEALSGVSSIQIRNNNSGSSTLQLDGSLGDVTAPAAIALNGRNVNVAAIQNLSGSNTLAGGITINVGGSYYVLQSDAGTLNLGGTITSVATGTRTFTFQGNGDFRIPGLIQNGSALAGQPRGAPEQHPEPAGRRCRHVELRHAHQRRDRRIDGLATSCAPERL
jgi:autotransporter-associated beta strand protein